jgi:hypothetical protein
MPHHVTQRGNRRQPTFFCDDDYAAYLELMGEWCRQRGVEVWAYCLMLKGTDDGLVRVAPLLELAGRWRRLLTSAVSEEQLKEFREHERTGRVLGDEEFQERLEERLGRVLRRQTPGPKKASRR